MSFETGSRRGTLAVGRRCVGMAARARCLWTFLFRPIPIAVACPVMAAGKSVETRMSFGSLRHLRGERSRLRDAGLRRFFVGTGFASVGWPELSVSEVTRSDTVVSGPRPRECRSSGVCVMYGKYRRGRECLPSVKNAAEPHAPVEPWSGACGPEDGKPLLFPRPGRTVGVRSLRGTCGRGGFRAAAGRFCGNEAVGQASEIENHPCRSFSGRGEIVGPHLSDGIVVSSFGGSGGFPSFRSCPSRSSAGIAADWGCAHAVYSPKRLSTNSRRSNTCNWSMPSPTPI